MIGAAPYASRTAQGTGAASNWALVLSIASAVMSVVGMFIWFAIVGQLALDKTGPTPTEAQMQQALQEIILQRRVPVSPAATTAMLVGCFCGIAALVLGIRSLVRGEGRNGRAIAACLIAAVFVFCQVIVMAAMFVHPPGLQP